jgi:hypothetical protein
LPDADEGRRELDDDPFSPCVRLGNSDARKRQQGVGHLVGATLAHHAGNGEHGLVEGGFRLPEHCSSFVSKKVPEDLHVVEADAEQGGAAYDLKGATPKAEAREPRDGASRQSGGEKRQAPPQAENQGEKHAASLVYGFKVLIEDGTERILGAHLVGPHVDDVINVFGLAIRHGLTADDLKTTMFAYPTGASDIGSML